MAVSNGIVWKPLYLGALRERAPAGDPALQQVLAGRFKNDPA